MDRTERTEKKVQELFHAPAAGNEGSDPEFMRILQRYIFGDVCYTGTLDDRMRELVTVTVLCTMSALPEQSSLASDDERYSTGLKLQVPVYGDEIKDRYAWLPGDFAEAVPRFLTELCFGDFTSRSGLDGKTRELLSVVLLAAMGGAEVQVKSHVYGALKCGCTAEEIVCALVHAACYMGTPRLFNALNACKPLLASGQD